MVVQRSPSRSGGINLYGYVGADPVDYVDVYGLSTTYSGQATYYNLPGLPTASGTPFDPNAMTAAMTAEKVPLETTVTVTYKSPDGTTTSVCVTVNDRGPFARNPDGTPKHPRQPDPKDITDLTPKAFGRLTGNTNLGRINVTVTVP